MVRRACPIDAATMCDSAPATNSRSPGVRARAPSHATSVDLPLPRGSESADVRILGANAERRKRRWKGCRVNMDSTGPTSYAELACSSPE